MTNKMEKIAIELRIQRLEKERTELATHIFSQRDYYENNFTLKGGLAGWLVGLFSSREKRFFEAELEKLYTKARQLAELHDELIRKVDS